MEGLFTAKAIVIYVLSFLGGTDSQTSVDDAYCLALNIHHEARSEPIRGQIQVAHTTLARVEDPRFPDDVCGVVYQSILDDEGAPKLHRCSFSWYCDGKSTKVVLKEPDGSINHVKRNSFIISSVVAKGVLDGTLKDACDGANFYYNPKLASPNWGNIYTHKCEIGNHVFLKREKGSLL